MKWFDRILITTVIVTILGIWVEYAWGQSSNPAVVISQELGFDSHDLPLIPYPSVEMQILWLLGPYHSHSFTLSIPLTNTFVLIPTSDQSLFNVVKPLGE